MTDRHSKLATLLGDYHSWLRRQAESMLGPVSPDLDDLVQEGYIAMWRALDSYEERKGSLPGWLTYRARTRMLNCVIQRHWTGQPPGIRDGRHAVEVRETLSLDVPAIEDGILLAELIEGPDLIDATDLAYHRGEIMAALASLTPKQRQYVEARFWRGMTESEMKAEVFGYDAGSLWRSAKNGARGKLAGALAHLAGAV